MKMVNCGLEKRKIWRIRRLKKNKKQALDFIPTPVTKYQAPDFPTLEELGEQPDLLKQMPHRWKKNATILACLGLIAPLTLSSCGTLLPNQPTHPISNDSTTGNYDNGFITGHYIPFTYDDLEIRLHGGGAGFASYVVYLTEQEALNFIRYQLEQAGLRFGDMPPDYTATVGFHTSEHYVGIDLFDGQHGVGVTFLDREDSAIPFHGMGHHIANTVAERFSEETDDVIVGVFYTSLAGTGMGRNTRLTNRRIRNAQIEARPIIEENLIQQTEEFIELLRRKGVL